MQPSPDLVQCLLQVLVDGWVDVAFAVSCDVQCALNSEVTINFVATHVADVKASTLEEIDDDTVKKTSCNNDC